MFRKAMLGDTATLNLDFTTGVLDSRLTFTRSGTGTYINSSGYITTASTNVARFDYDPTTLAPRGLLIEGSAINYMLYSTALDPHTNSKMRAVSTASITDPEGTTDKARIVAADGQTGYHARYLATTAGTNTTVTISIFAKKNGYKYLFISDLSLGRAAVRFDLDDGSTSNSSGAGFVSASATAYPNGWWRCSVVSTVTASTSYAWGYVGAPLTGATYGAAGVQYTGENLDDKGIYCYGFQVEAGAGASSYIPTAASQVTRNAEECRMTGTNFSSWFAGATEGVFFAEYEKPRKLGSQDYVALSTVYAAGALLNITTNTGTLWPSSICWPTGGALFPGGITTACPAVTKRAIRWFNGNDFSNFADGVLGTTSNGTGTLTMTMLNVGATTNTGTSSTSDWLNSCIKKIKFYPTALPNADIQTLTTP
jgi:hypothetical protein